MTRLFRLILTLVLLLAVGGGCGGESGPASSDGPDDASVDRYAGEGPVTQPVVDLFVPLDVADLSVPGDLTSDLLPQNDH